MARKLFELCGTDPVRRFSPYCWRSRMALAHKGLEAEVVPWRFTETEALASAGSDKVPVLVDGAKTIADSWSIAEYLEECYPEAPNLFQGSPASQRLTPDVITRGLTIVGAHDGHTRRDAERWDHDREIFRLFFRLVATGRFPLGGMITQRFDPSRAQEAYDFAEDHREGTMGLLFDWETT